MILAIDIGNTTTKFVLFEKHKIYARLSVDTPHDKKMLYPSKSIQLFLKGQSIRRSMICSVVPKATKSLKTKLTKLLHQKPLIVGEDIEVPIKNNYAEPEQVGQDRLVCAYGAKYIFGSPVIVIDLGTAITLEVVSRKGAYEGGMIIPGIKLSAKALANHTALLPQIDLTKKPAGIIGKNTEQSILSGLFHGYGMMCAGLIDCLREKLGEDTHVIATGGYAAMLQKYTNKRIEKVDQDLIFKGIFYLADGLDGC